MPSWITEEIRVKGARFTYKLCIYLMIRMDIIIPWINLEFVVLGIRYVLFSNDFHRDYFLHNFYMP